MSMVSSGTCRKFAVLVDVLKMKVHGAPQGWQAFCKRLILDNELH